jgi:DNA processing protein
VKPRILSGAALPPLVRDSQRTPDRLYLIGELPGGPAVAVVGTRQPTEPAAEFARQLAGELAAAGVAVFSGGASGIDAEAHRGALDVGGTTVVVAPSAFDRPYPAEHAELYQAVIAAGGGYVTREAPGTAADNAKFFPRNELLVALTHALIVVEAPLRSGARNAAKHARELGRPVFVVPSAPWNPRGLGCILELRLGARPLLRAADVLQWLAGRQLHPIAEPGAALRVVRAQLSLALDPLRPGPSAVDAPGDAHPRFESRRRDR